LKKTFDFQGSAATRTGGLMSMNLIAAKSCATIPEHPVEVQKSASAVGERPRTRWPEIRARSFDGSIEHPAQVENLLSRDEQEQLQRIATLIEYRRGGNTVFSEGEDAHFVYFIDDGIVRISRYAENGHRQILALKVPGDLFGLPDGGQYVSTAETVGPARIYRIPWQRMFQTLSAEPQLQLIFLKKVAYDYGLAERRIMVLGQQNTYQRLASFILELLQVPEFFDQRSSRLKLPVNRFDLADYLGTAPESAARSFARLERDGLVRRVTSRTLEILDVDGLKALQRGRRRGDRPENNEASAETHSSAL